METPYLKNITDMKIEKAFLYKKKKNTRGIKSSRIKIF